MQIRTLEISYSKNPLHEMVLQNNFGKLEAFCNSFVTEEEKKALYRMALTDDEEGRLPIEIVAKSDATTLKGQELEDFQTAKEKSIDLLRKIMDGESVKYLKEPIILAQYLKKFSIPCHAKMYSLMEDACSAMNTVRSKITFSDTHLNGPRDTSPYHECDGGANVISEWAQQRGKLTRNLGEYINDFFPQQMGGKYRFITDHTSYFAVAFFLPESACNDLLTHYSHSMNQYGLGNCGDMAFATLYHFNQLQLKKPINQRFKAEVVSISKGDHVFLIAERDYSLPMNDYHAWQSPNTLIIDTWSGEVFPGTRENIECHLRTYNSISFSRWDKQKCMPFFNPMYHGLSSVFWDFQPQNLYMVYLAKTQVDEWVWNTAVQDFRDSEGNYYSPPRILSSTVWEREGSQIFHAPQDSFQGTIEEQLEQFQDYCFESFVDKSNPERKIQYLVTKKHDDTLASDFTAGFASDFDSTSDSDSDISGNLTPLAGDVRLKKLTPKKLKDKANNAFDLLQSEYHLLKSLLGEKPSSGLVEAGRNILSAIETTNLWSLSAEEQKKLTRFIRGVNQVISNPLSIDAINQHSANTKEISSINTKWSNLIAPAMFTILGLGIIALSITIAIATFGSSSFLSGLGLALGGNIIAAGSTVGLSASAGASLAVSSMFFGKQASQGKIAASGAAFEEIAKESISTSKLIKAAA